MPTPGSPGERRGIARRDRVGLASAVRSEFTKLRSVRSTYWSLLVMIIVCVGMGVLFSAGQASQVTGAANAAERAAALSSARSGAVTNSLIGLLIGQLVIAVLGALTITSEYSTGMIRTSLTAMPRRGTVYAAKALVFGAVALVAGLVTSFASFLAGQAMLGGVHASASLSQPGVLRAVIGGGLFLAVCGLLSYGIGGVLRHTAGAIGASIGLLFVSWSAEPVPARSAERLVRPDRHRQVDTVQRGRCHLGARQRREAVLALDRVRRLLQLRGRRHDGRPRPVPSPRRLGVALRSDLKIRPQGDVPAVAAGPD